MISMLVIDGSLGEGGGQILRTASALAIITKRNVKITNIRKSRETPGLKMQHYLSLKFLEENLRVKIDGLGVGSTEIIIHGENIFVPKTIHKTHNLKTAGSITLFLQNILPVVFHYSIKLDLTIIGGTHVKYAPTTTYYEKVLFPILNKFGFDITMETIKRGYYPKGNGITNVKYVPNENRSSYDKHWWKYYKEPYIHEIYISKRLINKTNRDLCKVGDNYLVKEIDLSRHTCYYVESDSPGLDGIIYNRQVGIDYIGEKGKKLEDILEERIAYVKKCESENTRIDAFLGDQILLPLSLFVKNTGQKISLRISEETKHLKTNIDVINHFSYVDIERKNKNIAISPNVY